MPTWLAISATSIVLTCLFAGSTKAPLKYLWTYALLGAGLFAVPLALYIDSRLVRRWVKDVPHHVRTKHPRALAEWRIDARHFADRSPGMHAAGLALATFTLAVERYAGYFADYPWPAETWAIAVTFASAFLAGTGLFAMFKGSVVVWRLGRLRGCQVVLRDNQFGILATGRMLALCYLVIAVVWLLYTSSAAFGTPKMGVRYWLLSLPVPMLSLPTLPAILLSFVVCQIPLHEKMAVAKAAELEKLDRLIESLVPARLEDLTAERREMTEFLQRQKLHVFELPEWPFSGRSLVGIGGSTVMAASPLLFEAAPELVKLAMEVAH